MEDGWARVFIDVPWLGGAVYVAVSIWASLSNWRTLQFGRRTGTITLPGAISGKTFLARSCFGAVWGFAGLYLMAVFCGHEMAWGFGAVFGALLLMQLMLGMDSGYTLWLARLQESGRMPRVDQRDAEPGLAFLVKARYYRTVVVLLAVAFALTLEPLLFGAAIGLFIFGMKYRLIRRRLLRMAAAAQAAQGEQTEEGDVPTDAASG